MEGEERKLIKFSNYSLCVTLPKWVVKKLEWEKGEVVNLLVDEKKGEILIKKEKKTNSKEERQKTQEKIESKSKTKTPEKQTKKAVKSRW